MAVRIGESDIAADVVLRGDIEAYSGREHGLCRVRQSSANTEVWSPCRDGTMTQRMARVWAQRDLVMCPANLDLMYPQHQEGDSEPCKRETRMGASMGGGHSQGD